MKTYETCSNGDLIMHMPANHRKHRVIKETYPDGRIEYLYSTGRIWYYRVPATMLQRARGLGLVQTRVK